MLQPNNIWIKTNLAHSLLFQGRHEEALKVYKELKEQKKEKGKSYVSICLEDLDELEKNGILHKDMNKVRVTLGEWIKQDTEIRSKGKIN